MWVLHNILAFLRMSGVSHSIIWSYFSSVGAAAPGAPMTMDRTLSFTFQALSSPSLSLWSFSSFSCSFFLMLPTFETGHIDLYCTPVIFHLNDHNILSICICKPPQDLSCIVLHQLWRWLPFKPGVLQFVYCTDVSILYRPLSYDVPYIPFLLASCTLL